MSKPRSSKKKSTVKKDSDDTPVSLYPMTLDEALKRALGIKGSDTAKTKRDDENSETSDDSDNDVKDGK